MERFDGMAGLRAGLKRLAAERAHWAGIPMPLDGHPLVVEPKYPNAEKLASIGREPPTADEVEASDRAIRNIFWSDRLRSQVVVFERDGKITFGVIPGVHSFRQALMTLGASDAWGIEQEHNALQLLGSLVSHRQLKQYLLTGMFLETSKRSAITYMFRKLRPTVALVMRGETSRILATLCLHPIAYYSGSWAGAMCPTDDVVAHLMLMRGDEHMFWRRANQHHPGRPESGL